MTRRNSQRIPLLHTIVWDRQHRPNHVFLFSTFSTITPALRFRVPMLRSIFLHTVFGMAPPMCSQGSDPGASSRAWHACPGEEGVAVRATLRGRSVHDGNDGGGELSRTLKARVELPHVLSVFPRYSWFLKGKQMHSSRGLMPLRTMSFLFLVFMARRMRLCTTAVMSLKHASLYRSVLLWTRVE